MNFHRLPRWFAAIVVLLTLATARAEAGPGLPVGLPPPTAGAVASAAPDATAAGIEILAAGGNAVDAAVATALALAVVHPTAGNLGGGGFAVARIAGVVAALDFRETAPAAATKSMFLDANGALRPDSSLVGPLASGTPGSPAGYFELHRRFGRLPWARVVAPALGLARKGFVVTPRLHAELNEARDLLTRFPNTARVWLPGGAPPAQGSRMRLPQLAKLLASYAQRGPAALSAGSAARAMERTVRAHGGIMTAADLRAYHPVWREPVRFSAFGWQFAAMPLPSSGGIILAQTLGILERRGWASMSPASADRIHLLAEAW
ncbi:MAG: gamma-glutamyltransferase, partial [Acidobacteria bacterium]|nr:gamma-glutamyltransferase [Acidobacteriota bacterium]